jgi:uncharacterized SAM-binding protein YcdF (DUF218 family)
MFIFKQILTPFILPPGLFISILIISGVWSLHKKNWKTGIMALIFGCFMWALSISPLSDAMIRGLESEYGIPKNVKGNVIILLGRGVADKAPDLTGVGAPSGSYLTRIVTAVRLQKRLHIPIIVSGRLGAEAKEDKAKNKVIEDHIVKRFLTDLGVPAKKIIVEDKSRDTFENVKFTKEICDRSGFKAPVLVTSAYHLKRAVMTFDKVGLKVLPFPAGFESWEGKEYKWQSYLPGDFSIASIAIKEYLGLVFYKFVY